MPKLDDLKGSDVVMFLNQPLIEQEKPVICTRLVDVDDNGIWIEGRDLANFLHEEVQRGIIPKTPLFFVPFAQVGWILGSAGYPSLSEKALGL